MQDLQTAFAEVCNALAPVVQQTRCWNRVTLHHLTYKDLRERFPKIGSQMVCNAIYSVSRTSRLVFQLPTSPFNVAKNPGKALPLMRFLPKSPVYFDRHTLSLKDGQLSMYTLDGRMRFQLDLKPEDQLRFHQEKLREIVLSNTGQGYQLAFWFSSDGESNESPSGEVSPDLPEYLIVLPDEAPVQAAIAAAELTAEIAAAHPT
ncbi:MAG: hypothetical protein WCV99_07940 [Sterolibacterium sp.]